MGREVRDAMRDGYSQHLLLGQYQPIEDNSYEEEGTSDEFVQSAS